MKNWVKSQLKYWFLIMFIILFDQWSKDWIFTHFVPYDPYPLLSFLNITLAFNTGAAFSFLSGPALWHYWFFVIFALSMVTYLFYWLSQLTAKETQLGFAISLIIAGALSNVLDRILFGQVIDFIDVYYKTHHWPVFNVADSAICIGAVWLMLTWKSK
jgi:signal peptidase II